MRSEDGELDISDMIVAPVPAQSPLGIGRRNGTMSVVLEPIDSNNEYG